MNFFGSQHNPPTESPYPTYSKIPGKNAVAGGGKNLAFSFNFRTGQWQTGATRNVQGHVGAGLYGGAGLTGSFIPGAGSICDLAGYSGGIGLDFGVRFEGGGAQLTGGSAGPTLSVTPLEIGGGVSAYGIVGYTSAMVTNQGNLYHWLSSHIGLGH